MTDMTESLSFKLLKDKRMVMKLLCISVVLSWDELKVRQSLLDSDYETYMVCLLVAAVNWHKSLQFPKKSNIALLPCLFMILLAVSMITLIMLYHILAKLGFRFIYLLYLIISVAWQAWHRNSKMNQPPKYQEMVFFSLFARHLAKPFRNYCIQKTRMSRSINDSFAGWNQRMTTIVNLTSYILI